jgi:hypothetical protein
MFELLAQSTAQTDWERLLLGYGPLGLIVAGVAWLFWRYGPKLIDGHVSLMTTLEDTARRQTAALERLSDTQVENENAKTVALNKIVDQQAAIVGTQHQLATAQSKMVETNAAIHSETVKVRALQEKINEKISDSKVSIGISAETVNMPATEEERKAMERIERRKPQ